MQGITAAARDIKLGPGLAAGTQMGPLVSQEQLDRVTGFMDAGRREGACVLTGGGRVGERGYFVAPTLLTGTGPQMSVVKEEIFGPVVVADSFEDTTEIIARSNDTPYGLAAGVWTRDIAKAHRVAAELRAGTVWVNCFFIRDLRLPFGGFGDSGVGREGGNFSREFMTEPKAVVMQIDPA